MRKMKKDKARLDRSKDRLPDKLLIGKDDVVEICEKYIRGHRYSNFLMVMLGAFFSLVVSAFATKEALFNSTPFIVLSVSIMALLAVSFILFIKNRYGKNIIDEIGINVLKNADYTDVFIVAETREDPKTKQKRISVLTEPHGKSNFLLYLKNNEEKAEEELHSALAAKLEITPVSIKIKYQESYKEIKRTSLTAPEKLICFRIFTVFIDETARAEVEKKYSWTSLSTLLEDINSMSVNYDVVNKVHSLVPFISDSFVRFSSVQPLKIIWNMTNKCGYNCAICGAYTRKEELTYDQKSKAFLSILSVGLENISGLFFSGGDPLIEVENRELIRTAQKILGKDKITVVTTANGITAMENQNDAGYDLLHKCELTVDTIGGSDDNRRKEPKYARRNYAIINKNEKKISRLQIDVPIIEENITDEDISEFVNRISLLTPEKSINLIRLMPTGKLVQSYPSNYAPLSQVQKLQVAAKEKGIPVHTHCAFPSRTCNMLKEKIGIDCAGNVFACSWAGYVEEDRDKNPFYLGNIYEQQLKDILQSERYHALSADIHKETHHCRIINYTQNGNFKEDCDPLVSEELCS